MLTKIVMIDCTVHMYSLSEPNQLTAPLVNEWAVKRNHFDHHKFNMLTVDFGEEKTAQATECKEKCFQMSHLPIFTIVMHLKMCWC